MNYSNESIFALLRGPLLRTPQGLVVLLNGVVYLTLAIAYGVLDFTPPVNKTPETAVAFCLGWPLIFFMMWIKQGIPSFKASGWDAAFLILVACVPAAYVAIRS